MTSLDTHSVLLHSLAHSRSGDKGDRANIALFAYRPADYGLLVEQVTEQALATLLQARHPGRIQRFLLPRLHGMNFVIDDVLDGGVNSSLNLDMHGKALSSMLLGLTVQVPRGFVPWTSGTSL